MSSVSPSSSNMSAVSSTEDDDSNTGGISLEVLKAQEDAQRESILGFKPQKEIIYNLHLPYTSAIDSEATPILSDIKSGLAKSIQLRDIGIGAVHWTGQLTKYIKLYGRRFSKEDHLHFVNLFYDLMVMPTLELSCVVRFGNIIVTLLKKKELLSREDLTLEWRPLYDLFERSLYSKYELHGLHLVPFSLESTLNRVTKLSRSYFSLSSTQEMLDEWRPLMCPFDTSMIKAVKYFQMFLPSDLPPQHHDQGFKLWFEEFLQILDCGGDASPFVNSLRSLFARVSNRNIGYIDWKPYIPKLFDNLLQGLDLPVGGLVNGTGGMSHFGIIFHDHSSAIWIISLLGGGRETQTYLNEFLKATETYYHPSNFGKWTLALMDLLVKLSQCMVNRIDQERNPRKTWLHPVPDAYKLTDDDITQFVIAMKPVAFLAMFSKRGLREAASVMQHLASMRPEMIIPQLLETAYPAMETLTEPHRLISCMSCLIAVSRNLMQVTKYYNSGRQHVMPLLYLSLPGIDPNDINKCMTAMQLICTFVSLLPVVDCTQAAQGQDLSDDERELVSATAQMEDFVLLFLEKLISLIESYSHDHNPHSQTTTNVKLTPEENIMQKFINSTFNAVVQQCSMEIFKVVNRKVFDVISTSIFDIRIAGSFFGTLLKSLARAHPKECLALFVPHFHRLIMSHKSEATITAENLDGELLWNMKLLSDVICCDGKFVLEYIPNLQEILDFILRLESKIGYEVASSILEHTVVVLLNTYLLEYRSVPEGFDDKNARLPIYLWGVSGDLRNLNAKWHVASPEEKAAGRVLLIRYLIPELENITKVANGDVNMSREKVLQSLRIIDSCTRGFAASVPIWDGKEVLLIDSEVPLKRHRQITSNEENLLLINGRNPREVVTDAVRPLLDKLLHSTEDDTKSFLKIIDIYNHVMLFCGTRRDEFDIRWKSFHLFKKVMANKLLGKKKHVRSLLLHRIQLQHDLRLSSKDAKIFTERHKAMFLDLYRLSCSLYPEVRKKAQGVLNIGVGAFAYSSRVLIPSIIENLRKDDKVQHHEFKGALYVLLGDHSKPRLVAAKYWEPLLELWPMIVRADHSEKPSILALIDRLVDRIHRQFENPCIERITYDVSINSANKLWNSSSAPKCEWVPVTPEQMEAGLKKETARTEKAKLDYNTLVLSLVNLVNSGGLQWKFHELALELLALLLRYDVQITKEVVDLYTANLIHDSLMVRKLCINGMMAIVKQQKRRAPRLEVDLKKVCSGKVLLENGWPNNDWVKMETDFSANTEEKWESTIFIDKTHWGFYSWPKPLYYHAPPSQQPKLNRAVDELLECEKAIYIKFMDETYVEKLVACLCLEEQKGNDRFCLKRHSVFKGLFRNFGSSFVPLLRPHVERLIAVSDPANHESSHRVAAEILSGLIRGAKHWAFKEQQDMWSWVMPLLEKVLSSLTVENINFWSKCLELCSESRDPKRVKPMFDLLMDSPIRGDGGSFSDSGRMRILQSFLTQQEWRVPTYQSLVLANIRDNINHAYKNVRDRMGSFMCTIFICDREIHRGSREASRKQIEFIETLTPELNSLKNEIATSDGTKAESSDELKSKHRMCKTVVSWLQESFQRMSGIITPDVYQMLPLLCLLGSDCDDDELKTYVSAVLKLMPRTQIHSANVPSLLTTLTEISELKSWHARNALLKFIQAHVFYNIFTLGNCKVYFKDLVLNLLGDGHLEVRELAAITFGGLLQCGYLQFNQELLDHFERLSGDKKKRKRGAKVKLTNEDIVKRHAGILGLCACVSAYPYDVPEFIPKILMDLSGHLDDPQPIQMTVKKTLSNFRRTHYDNWQDHKQKFTDDQLVILTDVLVSPNYYA